MQSAGGESTLQEVLGGGAEEGAHVSVTAFACDPAFGVALLAPVQVLLPSLENLMDYSSPQGAHVPLNSTPHTSVLLGFGSN